MKKLFALPLYLWLSTAAFAQTIGAPGSGSSGAGTVTSVSVVSANGVTGSVANPTTTPAITLTCAGGTCAPAASPTFSGTVTMPDAGTWAAGGLNGSIIGGSTPAAGTFTALAATTLAMGGSITFSANTSIVGGINGTPNPLAIQTVNQTGANNVSTMTVKGGNNSQASGTNNAGGVAITGGNASGAGSTGNGGNVVITAGTTVGGIAGNIQLVNVATDAAQTDSTLCLNGSNVVFKGSGTIGICLGTSSERYKHDIADLDVGLPELMKLRAVQYYLNADHGDPNKMLYGFTAEQGIKVLPKLAGLDAGGQPNTFDYVGVVPILVKAVQDLERQVEILKAQQEKK